MSSFPIRLLATAEADNTLLVKTLIQHPNHNGLGRTPEGEPIPPHHLTEVVLSVNGEPRTTLKAGSGLAANPLFGWRVAGRPGDSVSVGWRDNLGNQGCAAIVVR